MGPFSSFGSFVLMAVAVLAGCGPNKAILRSNSTGEATPLAKQAEPRPSTVEDEVDAMRTADFIYILVIERRDDGVLDPEDKMVIRTATKDVNRRSMSGDGKAVILGSNFPIPPDLLVKLKERFNVQDLSDPAKAPGAANTITKAPPN